MTQVVWQPSAQQARDDDTIWMLDTTTEQATTIANGGLIDSAGTFTSFAACDPWRSGSGYTVETGRFTNGIRGNSTSGAWLNMPGEHLPTRSFTVEFWVKCDNSWSSEGETFLLAFGHNRANVAGPSVGIYSSTIGRLTVTYRHTHNGATEVAQTISDTASGAAGAWVGVFLTYDGTTLTLYKHAGGTLTTVGTKTVAPSLGWSRDDDRNGISILGGKQSAGGGSCGAWLISDIRISRGCRTPNQTTTVTAANAITFSNASTTTVRPNLRGIVSSFSSSAKSPLDSTVLSLAAGIAKIGRIDKILSACPMKTGTTDTTRPTLGHSGLYSYDFSPLNHTLDYYTSLGITPYVSLDSCPQLLGGGQAPLSAADCADPSKLVNGTSFAPQVPNDMDAYATMCADIYWHVTRTLGITPVAWGVGNEPTGASFWSGTSLQFNQLYAKIAASITAIDSDAYIGAPDDSIDSSFASSLITYCGANNVPLRFVSVHTYACNFGDFKRAVDKIAAAASTAGIASAPDVLVGEWNWQLGNVYGTGRYPYKNTNLWIGAWNASHNASSLIEMQNAGVQAAARFSAVVSETTSTGEDCMGLISSTKRWAPSNVLDMWSRIENDQQLTATSVDLENGVRAIAAQDTEGNVQVLAANFKWRTDRTTTLRVSLPSTVAAGRVSDYWIVDSTRSNAFDTPANTGTLESVAVPDLNDGVVTLTMQPRSVHLFKVAPNRRRREHGARTDIAPSRRDAGRDVLGRASSIRGLR